MHSSVGMTCLVCHRICQVLCKRVQVRMYVCIFIYVETHTYVPVGYGRDYLGAHQHDTGELGLSRARCIYTHICMHIYIHIHAYTLGMARMILAHINMIQGNMVSHERSMHETHGYIYTYTYMYTYMHTRRVWRG
jgi:hypothetical protein